MKIKVMALAVTLALAGCGKSAEVPAAAPTEAAKPLDAEGVVRALAKAGLPIENIAVLDEKTDSNNLLGRPGQYTSKVELFDHRHPKPAQGDEGWATVEVFATPEDAKQRRDYIAKMTDGVPVLLQYQVLRGKVLLRLDKVALPSEVKEYEAGLAKLIPE